MTMLASQITSLTVVYSIVYSGVNQRTHQSSASLAFVREIHRGPVNFPHKWPVARKVFPFDDVIMYIFVLDGAESAWGTWVSCSSGCQFFCLYFISQRIHIRKVFLPIFVRVSSLLIGKVNIVHYSQGVSYIILIYRLPKSHQKRANVRGKLPLLNNITLALIQRWLYVFVCIR